MSNPPISSPANYVPAVAVDFAAADGSAQGVSAANPLPVAIVSGGGTASLADQSVVDAAGVYWLVRDNGSSLAYLNWATGVAGTPSAPVAPAGKLTGEQVRGTQYNVTAAGTGTNLGDVVEHVVVLNIASSPASILTSTWLNITQGTVLTSAPAAASIAEIASSVAISNFPATQTISAASLPLPAGAATDAHLTSVQSAPGTAASTALTVQGSALGVALPVSGTVAISGTPAVSISGNPVLGAGANLIGAVNLDIGGSAVSAANPLPMIDAYTAPVAASWTSATALNAAATVATAGYDTVIVTLVGNGSLSGGVATFEVFDGAAWIPVKAASISDYSTTAGAALSANMNRGYQVPVAGFPQFRVRLSTAISAGSLTLTTITSSAPDTSIVTVGLDPAASLPAGTNAIGSITNASFGISGTLPAFAATPTVNVGTLPSVVNAAGSANIGAVNVAVGGTNVSAAAPLPVETDSVLDAVTSSGSVTSATTLASASTQGFNGGSFQLNSAGTSCVVTLQQSNDNVNWYPLVSLYAGTTTFTPFTTINTVGVYNFTTSSAYVRAQVTTYGSGTVAGYLTMKRVAATGLVSLLQGSTSIGNIGTSTVQVGYTDSTTALGSSAAFTGTSRTSAATWCYFKATAYADQAGTLALQISLDSGSTWQTVASVAVAAASAQSLSTPMVGAAGSATLYRVLYTNGATAQGTFRLASAFTAN